MMQKRIQDPSSPGCAEFSRLTEFILHKEVNDAFQNWSEFYGSQYTFVYFFYLNCLNPTLETTYILIESNCQGSQLAVSHC